MFSKQTLAPALLVVAACGGSEKNVVADLDVPWAPDIECPLDIEFTKALNQVPDGYTVKEGPIRLISDMDIIPEPKFGSFDPTCGNSLSCAYPVASSEITIKVEPYTFLQALDAQHSVAYGEQFREMAYYVARERALFDVTVNRFDVKRYYGLEPERKDPPLQECGYEIAITFDKGCLTYNDRVDSSIKSLGMALFSR